MLERLTGPRPLHSTSAIERQLNFEEMLAHIDSWPDSKMVLSDARVHDLRY